VLQRSISAREVFDLMARLDPRFDFGLTNLTDFDEYLNFLGVKLQPHELLFFGTYLFSRAFIRYFRLLQRIFPARELIENIIIKAVDNY
jgi:hypothetical protein